MTALASADPPTVHSPVFVDSNVFLYAFDEAHPDKQQAARNWRAELWKSRRGRVSFQVLGEFYVNALPDAAVDAASTVVPPENPI